MVFRSLAALSLIVTIGGCARAPLERLPLLSSVDIDQTVSRAGVTPGYTPLPPPHLRPDDMPRRGLLGRLRSRAERGKAEAEAEAEIPHIEPVAAMSAPKELAVGPAQGRGFFGRFRGGRQSRAEAPPAPPEPTLVAAALPQAAPPAIVPDTRPAPVRKSRRGLLRKLLPGGRAPAPHDVAPPPGAPDPLLAALPGPMPGTASVGPALQDAEAVDPVLASLPSEARVATPRPRRGFFARLAGRGAAAPPPPHGDPALSEVGPNEEVPEGHLARLCGVPVDRFGAPVSQHPETAPRYVLYDAEPGSTAERNWYLTGFDDGCARQLTGVMALFGAPEMHEGLRYGETAAKHPYTATDAAYERVKARVCKVGKGAPCGPDRAGFDRDTVFVTAYESFGASRWTNILIHDGAVVAVDIATK